MFRETIERLKSLSWLLTTKRSGEYTSIDICSINVIKKIKNKDKYLVYYAHYRQKINFLEIVRKSKAKESVKCLCIVGCILHIFTNYQKLQLKKT